MEWLKSLWDWWENTSPLANFLQVASAAAAVGGSVYGLMRRRLKREQEIQGRLEEALMLRKNEIDELTRKLAESTQNDPHAWLQVAAKERRSGDEEKAIEVLWAGVLRTNDAMHKTYLELARYHMSLYPYHVDVQLREAARTAHIATLLKPDDNVALSLLEEIDAVMKMNDLQRGCYKPHHQDLVLPDPGFYGSDLGPRAAGAVHALLARAREQRDAGHFIFFERLTHRARLIGLRDLGDVATPTLAARHMWAEALWLNGLYPEALTEVEAFLPICEAVSGASHGDTVNARLLWADILESLERYDEALQALDDLLPIVERVNGVHHPDTLAAQYLRAKLLRGLGRRDEALFALDTLLSVEERVLSVNHEHTLTARVARAHVLGELGRYDEALHAIDDLLPIREQVSGATHPGTLAVRHERAMVLERLRRYPEALQELDDLLPVQEEINGTSHPATLAACQLRAKVPERLHRDEEALQALDDLLPVLERVIGVNHRDTLAARSLQAELLKKLGR